MKRTLMIAVCGALGAATLLMIGFLGLIWLSHSGLGVTESDRRFMQEAHEQAQLSNSRLDFPVGCVVVAGDQVVGRGFSREHAAGDPRDHAEMVALTEALGQLKVQHFGIYEKPVTVYTTYEPCPMCEGFIVWKNVDRVVVKDKKGLWKVLRENFGRHLRYRWNMRSGVSPTADRGWRAG